MGELHGPGPADAVGSRTGYLNLGARRRPTSQTGRAGGRAAIARRLTASSVAEAYRTHGAASCRRWTCPMARSVALLLGSCAGRAAQKRAPSPSVARITCGSAAAASRVRPRQTRILSDRGGRERPTRGSAPTVTVAQGCETNGSRGCSTIRECRRYRCSGKFSL